MVFEPLIMGLWALDPLGTKAIQAPDGGHQEVLSAKDSVGGLTEKLVKILENCRCIWKSERAMKHRHS